MGNYEETKMRNLEEARRCLRLGDSNLKEGNFSVAITEFTMAIKLQPREAGPIYGLRAIAYASQGNFDEAVADLEKAVSMEPNNDNLRDQLTRIREKKERWLASPEGQRHQHDDALSRFNTAKEKMPNARTADEYGNLAKEFSNIRQVLKSLPSSFNVQVQIIEECESYHKQCEEKENQYKHDEALSRLSTAKEKMPNMQTADEYGYLTKEFASIGKAFESISNSFDVKVQIDECENYRKQCEEKEQAIQRQEKIKRNIRKGIVIFTGTLVCFLLKFFYTPFVIPFIGRYFDWKNIAVYIIITVIAIIFDGITGGAIGVLSGIILLILRHFYPMDILLIFTLGVYGLLIGRINKSDKIKSMFLFILVYKFLSDIILFVMSHILKLIIHRDILIRFAFFSWLKDGIFIGIISSLIIFIYTKISHRKRS